MVDDGFNEEELIGLPVGNRRILSRWDKVDDKQIRFYFDYVIQPRQVGIFKLSAPILLASVDRNSVAYRRNDFKGMRFSSHFNNNFFDDVRTDRRNRFERIMAKAEPFSLRVNPLPQGAPDHFNGLIGRPDITVQSDVENVRLGEPVQLEFQVSHPDLEFAELPALKNHQAFNRVFDIPLGFDPAQYQNGKKIIRQTLFADSIEVSKIPQLAVNYYDPESGQYRDLLTEALPIKVSAGEQFSFSDSVFPEGVQLINQVLPDTSGVWAHRWGASLDPSAPVESGGITVVYLAFITAPPLLFLLMVSLLGYRHWRQRRNSRDIAQFRLHIKAGFDPLVQLGLYLHKRVGLPPSQLNLQEINRRLTHYSVEPLLIERLCRWVRCYQEKFKADKESNVEIKLSDLIDIVHRLDSQLVASDSRVREVTA